MKLRSAVLLACLLPAPAPARSDEVRLLDGRVLVGSVERKGDILEVMTRDGVVRVAADQVERIRTEDELRKALKQLEEGVPDTPHGHLQLAEQAFRWDLDREMWRHLDAVVAVRRDPQYEGSGLVRRLNDFLAQLEPELLPRRHRGSPTRKRVKELLYRVRRGVSEGKLAAVEELLVREANADPYLRLEARYGLTPERRVVALEALARRPTTGNDRFLFRTAIIDRYAAVREHAAGLIARRGQADEAVHYLAPGLMHQSPEVRIRTAKAYGNLGSDQAILYLVAAGPSAGAALADAGPGVRAHIAILDQQAYIRDFDVEVAQASFIADPKVDVLQSGVVLDATVAAVVLHRTRIVNAYRGALRRLAGSDPGPRPTEWPGWLAKVRAEKADPAPETADRGGSGRKG